MNTRDGTIMDVDVGPRLSAPPDNRQDARRKRWQPFSKLSNDVSIASVRPSAVPLPAAALDDVNMNIASPRSNAAPLPASPPCAYATDKPSVRFPPQGHPRQANFDRDDEQHLPLLDDDR